MMKKITTMMTTALIYLAGGGVASAQTFMPAGIPEKILPYSVYSSKNMKKILFLLCSFILLHTIAKAQYTFESDRTAAQLMDQLLTGEGMSIHNVTLNCPGEQNLTYVGEGIPFIDSGIQFSVGRSAGLLSPIGAGFAVTDIDDWMETGDADLNAIYRSWGVDTYLLSFRTCALTFDMVPYTDSVNMDFVFLIHG